MSALILLCLFTVSYGLSNEVAVIERNSSLIMNVPIMVIITEYSFIEEPHHFVIIPT